MFNRKSHTTVLLVTVCVAVMSAFMAAPKAVASELNQKSTITFSAPFEVSGKVLPAGTYVFKLVGLGTDNVVQILNDKETHAYATVLTSPNYRERATQDTVIRFAESAAGSPPAIAAWFYEGRHTGHEFPLTR